jgi:hypothetical protein
VQDSAAPFHDWNERIAAECYGPNGAARLKGGDGRICDIVNNYVHLSFNFGPTLLAWLERQAPEVYRNVLEADARSVRERGHGNAIAQGYNHAILPLCNERDLRTQIRWGLADFRHRFGRKAEGLWLPETAADLKTLLPLGGGLRLVKGAYREPPDKEFPKKSDVDENYFKLAGELLSPETRAKGVRAIFGTHDPALIARIEERGRSLGLPPEALEFQMLYGIRRQEQERLAKAGHVFRVLISYGDAWFPWYMRRLAERPANVLFVARNLFTR